MPEHQESSSRVVVLSYSRYCRHRALAKRLESNIRKQESLKIENVCTKMENIKLEPSDQQNTASFNSQLNSVTEPERINQVNKALADSLIMSPEMQDALIQALGGYVADVKNTRILFCRETFSYPDLETHEMLCNHLAPKLKGRPRGRRKKQILPIFNSTRKRQLLAINSDKNKGRKSQHDDDEERRMLQMLAGLSDSGGEISADSDDLGSEHMPCAATVVSTTILNMLIMSIILNILLIMLISVVCETKHFSSKSIIPIHSFLFCNLFFSLWYSPSLFCRQLDAFFFPFPYMQQISLIRIRPINILTTLPPLSILLPKHI